MAGNVDTREVGTTDEFDFPPETMKPKEIVGTRRALVVPQDATVKDNTRPAWKKASEVSSTRTANGVERR